MKTVISIILILVGFVGIYLVSQSGSGPAPESRVDGPAQLRDEIISVAFAKRDIPNKAILTPDDFQIKTITVSEKSAEITQFSLSKIGSDLSNWAVSAPIQEGSNIPVSLLVKPGSTEYISMFLQPGNVIYSFTIPASDYYIFDNLRVGEYVDVYLSYEQDQIPETANLRTRVFKDARLKLVMANKRVLSIAPSLLASKKTQTNTNKNKVDGEDQIVVELTDHDLKVLKALEGKAHFIIFPSVPKEVLEERMNAKMNEDSDNAEESSDGALTNREKENWPVTNEELFGSTTVKRIEG